MSDSFQSVKVTNQVGSPVPVTITGGAGSGGTSATDEAGYTPASSAGTPLMGAVDEAAPTAAPEDSLAIIRATTKRAMHVNLRDSSGNEVSVGGGTQYTEDAPAAADPVGTALNLVRSDARGGGITSTDGDNIAARGTNNGELYVKHVDAINLGTIGSASTEATLATRLSESDFDTKTGSLTESAPASDTASSGLNGRLQRIAQRLTSLIALLPSALTGSGNLKAALVESTATVSITGSVAHGASNTANPLLRGCEAIAHGSNPTAVSAGQLTKNYANRHGIPFTIGGHPNSLTLELAYTAGQTDVAIITVGAGTKIVVTRIAVVMSGANSVDAGFRIGFGTANTPTTTGVVLSHPALKAGSGFSCGDGAGILGIGADNEDLRITADAPTSGSARVLVTYFTIES